MTTAFESTINRASSGTFAEKSQMHPEFELGFHAGSTGAATEDELRQFVDSQEAAYDFIGGGFDRSFAGDLDGARAALLARSEGLRAVATPDGADAGQDFYNIVLARESTDGELSTMSTPFSTASGLPPTTSMVLSALLADSAALNEVDDVYDWANQLGFDMEDEPEAVQEGYNNVIARDQDLRSFLGTNYDTYLWGDQ